MATQNPINCPMCGHVTFVLQGRWYKYDNGEMFFNGVCPPCVALHDQLAQAN